MTAEQLAQWELELKAREKAIEEKEVLIRVALSAATLARANAEQNQAAANRAHKEAQEFLRKSILSNKA